MGTAVRSSRLGSPAIGPWVPRVGLRVWLRELSSPALARAGGTFPCSRISCSAVGMQTGRRPTPRPHVYAKRRWWWGTTWRPPTLVGEALGTFLWNYQFQFEYDVIICVCSFVLDNDRISIQIRIRLINPDITITRATNISIF